MDARTPNESPAQRWAATMAGSPAAAPGVRQAHAGPTTSLGSFELLERAERESLEAAELAPGATRSCGAGHRQRREDPDEWRTCFERDRDRILHSTAFRRLAGKTQVFVFPADHQRTRLTHALEVAQVATAIARACRLNLALTEAIALGHDCGHGPGGHASEEAFSPLLDGDFDHATWGADVTAAPLNLCAETLDGIRNHSWSRPSPSTPEGQVVSIADRVAYCAHDFEDAVHAGIVDAAELPEVVVARCGRRRSSFLRALITDVVTVTQQTGMVALSEDMADALAALRQFNYDRIYLRHDSVVQAGAVVDLLRALVEFYQRHPEQLPDFSEGEDPTRAAVAYVGGMTDRFACRQAVRLLDYPRHALPRGIDQEAGTAERPF